VSSLQVSGGGSGRSFREQVYEGNQVDTGYPSFTEKVAVNTAYCVTIANTEYQ